jgi:hypothetical protein
MFKMNSKVAVAVAGVLASVAANAANIDLYVAGASAQSAFWKADMTSSVCGGTTPKTYKTSNSSISNETWRCTAAAPATGSLPSGIAVGDIVSVYYNSHFGSISGAAALVRPATAKRLYVNPDSTDCTGSGTTYTCAITAYDQNAETHTSLSGNAMIVSPNTKPADVVVLDVELKHWGFSQNWQPVAAFGLTAPSSAEIAAVTTTPTIVNGQLFTVIANNSSPIAAKGNISKESLKAIVTGVYDKWGDVPEVGGADTTAIKYCRREPGSGTQVAASIFLTGFECGRSSSTIVTQTSYGALGSTGVSEETSTSNVRTCVQGTTGAIGIASLSRSTNYATLSVDGVEANAHNAATGMYTFAFEDIVYNQSTTSGASSAAQALATLFVNNARKATTLSSQIETTATTTKNANGTWTSTAPKGYYALPITGVNSKSVANATSGTQAVTALAYRAGDNCKVLFNSNAQ